MENMKPKRRWMPVVLTVSLALNCAVIAAIGGAVWRNHGGPNGGMPRDGGAQKGAAFVKALPPEARAAVRDELRNQPRLRMDNSALLAALRKDPFDTETAALVLDAQRNHGLARNDIARAAWFVQVEAMTAQERAQYADRLEEMIAQKKDKPRKDRDE
ncbi:periplasmic heavy metal sensor [Sulfitobacter sp.]|uniref:periplasmic heavy metal sensor n=1 Tax=Sulfitobacter sp. TaxID=1903071 RepID=UPI00329A4360